MRIPWFSNLIKLHTLRSHPIITAIIFLGILTRIAYDAVSVQSPEFISWMSNATADNILLSPGIYTAGAYMFSLAYRLWLALPADHPSLTEVYVTPQGAPEIPPVFQPSLSNYIFVFTMKTPIILFDIFILALIFRIVASKTNNSRTGMLAVAAWAWNPLVTLLENYNGIDITAGFFLLLAAFLFERKKTALASITLTLGAFLRSSPALFLPAFALSIVKKREWRALVALLVPSAFIVGGALALYAYYFGFGILEAIVRQRPGILSYELLAFMGPVLTPRLGLAWNGFLAFNLISYFLLINLTSSRIGSAGFGDQITSVLLAFFASSWFHFAFLLWVLPILTIDNLGLNRRTSLYVLVTVSGLLWTIFQASTIIFSFGKAILFIPATPGLLQLSAVLSTLQFYKGLEYLRALLSGSLLAQLALIVLRNIPRR